VLDSAATLPQAIALLNAQTSGPAAVLTTPAT